MRLSVRAALLAGAALVAASAPAVAQTRLTPVIDSVAPRTGFRGSATIRAHVEGGEASGWVALSKRKPGGEWFRIASKPVDEDKRMRFRLDGLKITADYRLSWFPGKPVDPVRSDVRTVRVRPEIGLHVSRTDVAEGAKVRVTGHLYPKVPGRRAVLQRRVDGRWYAIDRVRIGDGWFSTRVTVSQAGLRRFRLRFGGDASNLPARDTAGVRVYARELATWYGPGLYGNRTACGQTLTSETLGVAHRSLPCGTGVRILYGGRKVRVPVIDRGPYTSANWDLTQETAERLGFSGKENIGVLVP